MSRRTKDPEQTPELTGADAPQEEADAGSSSPAEQRALEPEPRARDIRPDRVERHPAAPRPSGEAPPAPTAQPTEWPDADASRLP